MIGTMLAERICSAGMVLLRYTGDDCYRGIKSWVIIIFIKRHDLTQSIWHRKWES